MEGLLTTENLIALVTLTSLEIVLGIDNIIFIAILAGRLPPEQRDYGRKMGLMLAVVSRIALLMSLGWVMSLKQEAFSALGYHFTWKDLVILGGGLFLIYKAVHEMHNKISGHHEAAHATTKRATLASMLWQVLIIDIVFSLDSVITAVGMSKNIPVMVAAILLSVAVMLLASGAIVRFVDRHPAIKLLALSFLLMIGVLLVGEAFHHEIPKGYIYFAMAFALVIELLKMQAERNALRHQHNAGQAPHGT